MLSISIGAPALLSDPSVLFCLVTLGGGAVAWVFGRLIDVVAYLVVSLVARRDH